MTLGPLKMGLQDTLCPGHPEIITSFLVGRELFDGYFSRTLDLKRP